MYKIFHNERFLEVVGKEPKRNSNTRIIFNPTIEQIELEVFNFRAENSIKNITIVSHNVLQTWTNVCRNFSWVEAAGGLVVNEQNELLVIFRRERWDLPKGHVDAGESPEIAALREVQEECGISCPTIISKLTSTYHIYFQGKKWFLKQTHWYNMQSQSHQALVPQIEESISDIRWIDGAMREVVLRSTYASLHTIFDRYF